MPVRPTKVLFPQNACEKEGYPRRILDPGVSACGACHHESPRQHCQPSDAKNPLSKKTTTSARGLNTHLCRTSLLISILSFLIRSIWPVSMPQDMMEYHEFFKACVCLILAPHETLISFTGTKKKYNAWDAKRDGTTTFLCNILNM